MTRQPTEHSVIPEGEHRCIWMDAGVVDYKLCDRRFACEGCPFDEVIRAGRERPPQEARRRADPVHSEYGGGNGGETVNSYFDRQLARFLEPFRRLHLPRDRKYCLNHVWMSPVRGASYYFGIDNLATHLLGDIKGVVLPQTPAGIQANGPSAWIIHREGAVALKLPFAVTITSTNELLRDVPNLLSRRPYDRGWIFQFVPSSEEQRETQSCAAATAEACYTTQAEALARELRARFAESETTVGATMLDGGTRIVHVQDMIGERAYFEIISPLFGMK